MWIMKSFDEISNENMVLFYREEFEMIDQGSSITDLIPKQVRFRLRLRGLIEPAYGLNRNCGFVLSSKGREILDSCARIRNRETSEDSQEENERREG